ncbi:nuclear receptor coactivator 5 [Battus philenor]|uniref:nuclear receptor coactivator 5 n=1 Tax=Battus philenor TaxID=42288 RepID=UPI0035CF89E5
MSKYQDKLILGKHAMKGRCTAHLRIYVGGLTERATTDDLYEHFIPFGQINGIIVNRSFGFVQFENESSAQEAIAKRNGSIFQGKTLCVRTAQFDKTKREPEVTNVSPDLPPTVALNDTYAPPNDEGNDNEPYDSFGNYIGDKRMAKSADYRDEEYDEGYGKGWGEGREANETRENRGGIRGRGGPRGRGPGRGRGVVPSFRDRTPVAGRGSEWQERNTFDRYSQHVTEYPRNLPVTERNDCEIIVVSKALTEYAEYIEDRLKRLGIVVDLLFPMEDVPIGKVLGNIANRGCLYAILVMPQNQEHRSLTLTILHGLPQEHRNMPLEDALQLLSRNFQEVQHGGSSGREAVYALLGQLADGRSLTVLQYDKVIEYLQDRKEHQIKLELGEPLASTTTNSKAQTELQQRIMSILNEKKALPPKESSPIPTVTSAQGAQQKLLNDPTLKKALDSILQKYI